MSGSVDFFLKDRMPEDSVVEFFNRHIEQGVESLEYPKADAALFLQYFEYDSGFHQSAGLAWGLNDFELDDVVLAQQLANAFSTEVLFEPQRLNLPAGMQWCLAKPDGSLSAVNIIELNDGLDVAGDAVLIESAG